MDTVTLSFVRNYGAYFAGQQAWFPVSAATPILAAGAATIVPPTVKAKPAAAVMAERTKSRIIKK